MADAHITRATLKSNEGTGMESDSHVAEAQRLLAGVNQLDLGELRADVIARATAHATLALALQRQGK